MNIKELRKEKGLTQVQASQITGIPLRTYKLYENDSAKEGNIKYIYIQETLAKYGYIDETHGILTPDQIERKCSEVFASYPVDYAILFGSYAKGTASESSDVDLLVATSLSGLKFYGMVDALRNALHKNVDVLDIRQLEDNPELLNNVLKEGIRIYVQG